VSHWHGPPHQKAIGGHTVWQYPDAMVWCGSISCRLRKDHR
jgi:hypothetical protein